jgi:Leucine Rich repeat
MAAYALPQRSRIDDLLQSRKRISYTRRKLFEDYETRIKTMESVDILHSDEDDVMEKVAETLTIPNIKIKKLFLMRGITVEGARILGDALPKNTTLTVLKVLQNGDTAESLPGLLGFLQKNQSITDLFLNDCPFEMETAEALGQTLTAGHLKKLSVVNIPSFGPWVGLVVDRAMKDRGCQLQQVKLIRCEIDAYGATQLATALTLPHTTLQLLNLEGNPIGNEGTIALAEALTQNRTLEHLILGRSCELGDPAAEAVAKMLPHNNTLKEIYLAGNPGINIRGKEALAEGCKRNVSLTNVGMRMTLRHPIRPTVLEQITDSLAVNSARDTWNQTRSDWTSSLLPHYLARVAAKPAVLFMCVQENGDLFLPYVTGSRN